MEESESLEKFLDKVLRSEECKELGEDVLQTLVDWKTEIHETLEKIDESEEQREDPIINAENPQV